MNLRKVIMSSAKQLDIELELLREALSHSTQKGSVAESAFLELFRQFLPERLGVTEGIVISSDNFVSSQIDIILYDKTDCPVVFSKAATKIIPIEFVYAIFEIKTSLKPDGFDQFETVQRLVKMEKKYLSKAPSGTYDYYAYGKYWDAPPIMSGIISLECTNTDPIWNKYATAYSKHPKNQCIDFILAGTKEYFCHWDSKNGISLQLSSIEKLVRVKTDPLFAWWLGITISSTQWKMLQVPEMYRYCAGDFITDELTTNFIEAEHSQIK